MVKAKGPGKLTTGWTPGSFLKTCIKTGNLPAVILFGGSEDYWQDLHIQTIRKQLFPEDQNSLSAFHYQVGLQSVEEMLEEAESFAFFGTKKLITYGDVTALNAADQKTLCNYVDNPNGNTILLLRTRKLDGRSLLAKNKTLKKNSVNFEITGAKDILDFIQYKLKIMGNLKITRTLQETLLEGYAETLRSLSHTLDKVAAYANYQSPLDIEHLLPCQANAKAFQPFAFTDAILHGNLKQVLPDALKLPMTGEQIFPLLGLLRSQFRKCLQIKSFTRLNRDPTEIASLCKLPPFVVQKLRNSLKDVSEQSLNKRYQMLAECDYQLKSSPTRPEHLFLMLLYRLCKER